MGRQLSAIDILGVLGSDEGQGASAVVEEKPAPARPADQTSRIAERKAAAEEASAGKPSPYTSDLREKLRKKKQFTFSDIPTFIIDEYARLQKEAGMNKREFLYHLLREKGAAIPPYETMDGRKL